MTRTAIDGGGWFDRQAATCYEESTHFDGRNMISDATGSQWQHECLYRTRRGVYILHAWSQWQGSSYSYTRISVQEAGEWLARMGHEPETPAEVRAVEAAEV